MYTKLLVVFLKIGSIIGQDLAYLDLGVLEDAGSAVLEGRSIPSTHKYVDIYTNEPNLEKVLNSYNEIKEASKKIDFATTEPPFVDRNRRRPNFRTSKHNLSEIGEASLPFTNIQKIPKRRPLDAQINVNEILKKYIAKLYAQRPQKRREQRKHDKKIQSKFLEEPWRAFKNKTMKFAKKFLSLFTIIEFPNSRCQATSASSVYGGTCYHRSECESLNGTAIGQCANGYGVCCVCKFFRLCKFRKWIPRIEKQHF